MANKHKNEPTIDKITMSTRRGDDTLLSEGFGRSLTLMSSLIYHLKNSL